MGGRGGEGEQKIKQRIIPTLMFVGKQCGKAEEAINYYASVFGNARVGDILRYSKGEEPDKEGTVKHAVSYSKAKSLPQWIVRVDTNLHSMKQFH